MSVDSLIWRTPENDEKTYSGRLEPLFKLLSGEVLQYVFAQSHGDMTERRTLFDLPRTVRKKIHNYLDNYFQKGGQSDAEYMGLDPNKKFEVHASCFALRTKPDGGVVPQLLVTVLQADNVPADATDPNGPSMIFEGGSSIVADLRRRVVKYCIRKNLKSKNRLAQLQGFCMTQITNARSTSSTRIPTTRSASSSRCCTADCERGQPCQPFHAKLPRRRKQPSVAFVARGRLLVS